MKRPKYPSPPRSMCGGFIQWLLGIHSPSRELHLRMYGPQNEAERKYYASIVAYHQEMERYKIFTRTMTRGEWKVYYHAERLKRRMEVPNG